MNHFGKNLKTLMKKLALSQASIEKIVDKRQTTISNWINGKTNPDAEDLIKLSEFFGLQIDDLCSIDLSSGNLMSEDWLARFKQFGSLKGSLIGSPKSNFNQNIGEVQRHLSGTQEEEELSLWTVLVVLKEIASKLDLISNRLEKLEQD